VDATQSANAFAIAPYFPSPLWSMLSGHCHHLSVECLAICTHRKILPAITPRNAGGISPRARPRENLLTFFLNDEKESKQRKNRRHRFIGQFFLYTDSVNLNTLFTPCLLNYMAFSSSHPVLIQKPRRSPLRRSKLLLYVIAVNTLYL